MESQQHRFYMQVAAAAAAVTTPNQQTPSQSMANYYTNKQNYTPNNYNLNAPVLTNTNSATPLLMSSPKGINSSTSHDKSVSSGTDYNSAAAAAAAVCHLANLANVYAATSPHSNTASLSPIASADLYSHQQQQQTQQSFYHNSAVHYDSNNYGLFTNSHLSYPVTNQPANSGLSTAANNQSYLNKIYNQQTNASYEYNSQNQYSPNGSYSNNFPNTSCSNSNNTNFWWSKFQNNTPPPSNAVVSVPPQQTSGPFNHSLNYSTPQFNSNMDGIHHYNSLLRNLHSKSSSTSSSPNSSTSSATPSTHLMENTSSYHHLMSGNLPLTPEESNSINTDINASPSSSCTSSSNSSKPNRTVDHHNQSKL